MSQSQVLQNSKVDGLSVKAPNMRGRNINNLAAGVNPQDAVNVSQLNSVITSVKELQTGHITNIQNISSTQNTAQQAASNIPSVSSGVFTPVLKFGGATTGITYGTQTGLILTFGNVVIVTVSIVLTSKGSATGVASVSGFVGDNLNLCVSPFGFGSTDFIVNGALAGNVASLAIGATSAILGTSAYPVTPANQLQDTDFTNTTAFNFQFTYIN